MIGKRDDIVRLRTTYPEMTLSDIGGELGLSRERVRQILVQENLETRSTGRIPIPMPTCKMCNNLVPTRKHTYCSPKCQRPNGRTTTRCYGCNKEITLMTSQYKARTQKALHVHCSRACRDESRRGKTNLRYNE